MDLIKALNQAGFTGQEALIYLTLGQHGELSGYEAAKIAGISRSNAYSALSSLVEKGGAFVIEGKTKKYTATPKDELLQNIRRSFNENMAYLDENLKVESLSNEPYFTVRGSKTIIDKIKNMILLAKQRIYISGRQEDLNLFIPELTKSVENDLKVVIICDHCKDIPHTLHYHNYQTLDGFKIIVDTEEVLTGKTGLQDQALYSKNITLVHFIREALINEIELIKIRNNIHTDDN